MIWLGAIGGSCFVLAGLVLGTRLLLSWRKTRKLPELTLGLGLLLMGGLSYPLLVVARVVPDLGDSTRIALTVASQILMGIGVTSVGAFNWRVFRPDSRIAASLVVGLALAFLLLMALQAWDPGYLRFALRNEGILRWSLPLTGFSMYWAAFETWRYFGLLQRRHALGMADPIVLDRMRLWGIATTAASVINISTWVSQLVGIDPATAPAPAAITGVFGLVAAAGVWLAFFPPESYRQHVLASG